MKNFFFNIFGTTFHLFYNIFHSIFELPFIVLTLVGNLVVSAFAFTFYFLEKDINPKLHGLIDAFWWSFATATTTGYGDITPITFLGKFLGILLMLVGTAIFSLYTAYFARAFLGGDFNIKPRKKN
jgi:voltage-gated potassium channel